MILDLSVTGIKLQMLSEIDRDLELFLFRKHAQCKDRIGGVCVRVKVSYFIGLDLGRYYKTIAKLGCHSMTFKFFTLLLCLYLSKFFSYNLCHLTPNKQNAGISLGLPLLLALVGAN